MFRPELLQGLQWDSTRIVRVDRTGETYEVLDRLPLRERLIGPGGRRRGLFPTHYAIQAVADDGFYWGLSNRYEIAFYDARGELLRILRRPVGREVQSPYVHVLGGEGSQELVQVGPRSARHVVSHHGLGRIQPQIDAVGKRSRAAVGRLPHSRFLLECPGMLRLESYASVRRFRYLFREFGLSQRIRLVRELELDVAQNGIRVVTLRRNVGRDCLLRQDQHLRLARRHRADHYTDQLAPTPAGRSFLRNDDPHVIRRLVHALELEPRHNHRFPSCIEGGAGVRVEHPGNPGVQRLRPNAAGRSAAVKGRKHYSGS